MTDEKQRFRQCDKVNYKDLNARQKENRNFHKLAGRLADYGYNCIRLSDDWMGADFIASHKDGKDYLKVQLKSRLSFHRKYQGKDMWIAFVDNNNENSPRYYIFQHDYLLKKINEYKNFTETNSWIEDKMYTYPNVPVWADEIMKEFEI
jgi:hypothetical protein